MGLTVFRMINTNSFFLRIFLSPFCTSLRCSVQSVCDGQVVKDTEMYLQIGLLNLILYNKTEFVKYFGKANLERYLKSKANVLRLIF